jgi:hypothetical protein
MVILKNLKNKNVLFVMNNVKLKQYVNINYVICVM